MGDREKICCPLTGWTSSLHMRHLMLLISCGCKTNCTTKRCSCMSQGLFVCWNNLVSTSSVLYFLLLNSSYCSNYCSSNLSKINLMGVILYIWQNKEGRGDCINSVVKNLESNNQYFFPLSVDVRSTISRKTWMGDKRKNMLSVDWMDQQPAYEALMLLISCGCKTNCTTKRCSCIGSNSIYLTKQRGEGGLH
jgi:hypothetical protein